MVLLGSFRVVLRNFVLLTSILPLVLSAADVVHYQRLMSFGSVTNDGVAPVTALVQGPDGALYGTTHLGGSNGFGTIFKLNVDGSGYQTLHNFGDGAADGQGPLGALKAGSDAQLYGTTAYGGTRGDGTIFKLQPDGSSYTVLHTFAYVRDGSQPEAGLIEGSDGALYGTTYAGPTDNYGGTVFVIKKDGTGYRLLHHFGPWNSEDGLQPSDSVLEGSDGALYGTTVTGGGSAVGSIFKLNKDGTGYRKLFGMGFGGVINPFANLLEGSDQALYGVGRAGVFKLSKDGTGFQVIHTYNDDWPFAALVKGRDGALYSTTFNAGGAGYVYRLKEDGADFEIMHRFGDAGDGANPESAPVLGKDGAFYGTTLNGGDFGVGTVFRMLVNQLPVAQCKDVVVSADSNCLALVSVDNGSFDPDGDPITLVQSPAGLYPLGTNQVILTVTDSNGDSSSCTSSVVVLDTTPPQIACPSNIVAEFTSDAGAMVTFTVVATDSCDSNPVVTSVPASGTLFPIGTTEVRSTATDVSGNQASCTFNVTVLGARGVKQYVLAQLTALRETVSCNHGGHHDGKGSDDGEVCPQLDNAIRHLNVSLNPAWWIDETHVQTRQGGLVFEEERAAAEQLCFLLHHRPGSLPDSLLQELIEQLNRADHLLAAVAIQEAQDAGATPRRIDQARKFLAEGDHDATDDPCSDAIVNYHQAWTHAVRAKATPPVHLPDGHVQLELLAEPGTSVIVQASTNLVDWASIGTATADADGVVRFEDKSAAGHAIRYYRLITGHTGSL